MRDKIISERMKFDDLLKVCMPHIYYGVVMLTPAACERDEWEAVCRGIITEGDAVLPPIHGRRTRRAAGETIREAYVIDSLLSVI